MGTSFYHILTCLRNISPGPRSNLLSAPDSYHLQGMNETGDSTEDRRYYMMVWILLRHEGRQWPEMPLSRERLSRGENKQ